MITHQFEQAQTIAIGVAGFTAEKVEALADGAWHIRAEVQSGDTLTGGVVRRPIKYEVRVERQEVAQSLGIDTEAEDWETTYNATPIANLKPAVVGTAVAKVMG